MARTFELHILASDRPFYEGECESVIIPTSSGQYGIMARHRNMISALVPGTLTYKLPGEEARIASVSSGLIKVEDNHVLILVDSAERPEEIDINLALKAADEAREAILQKKGIEEYKSAQIRLARAVGRLKVRHAYETTRYNK